MFYDIDKLQVDEVFKLFVSEGDGRVSKDNFMCCLKKNPLLIALFSPCLVNAETGDRMLEEIV